MSIKHPLRKLSKENWKRYGKVIYKIGHRFCSIKQKIVSSFNLLREDLAQKASHCLCSCLELLSAWQYFCYCYPASCCITTMLKELVDF
jgi:hypothetical protein